MRSQRKQYLQETGCLLLPIATNSVISIHIAL